MSNVDLKRVEETNEHISELTEVVAEFETWVTHPLNRVDPLRFKVKVLRYSNGKYMGIASHRIGNYLSLHQQDTVELALQEALGGVRAYYNPERPLHEQFLENGDY